jgi:membrane protein
MESASVGRARSTVRRGPTAVWRELRGLQPRLVARRLIACERENDLLTFASAISFQVFFALIPLLLLAFGILGAVDGQSVWRQDLAPNLAHQVPRAVYTAIDQTVTDVLERKQLVWITFGAAFAVWQVSGAVRAVMGAMNKIYDCKQERSFWRRLGVSIALAVAVTVLLLVAVGVVKFGPLLVDEVFHGGRIAGVVAFVVQWLITAALLLVVVGMLVRCAPTATRPWSWVSFGAMLVVGAWIAMSLLFSWYLTSIADYGSIFGSLATLIVLMEYLYLSSIVFLSGIQLDALARAQVDGQAED